MNYEEMKAFTLKISVIKGQDYVEQVARRFAEAEAAASGYSKQMRHDKWKGLDILPWFVAGYMQRASEETKCQCE